MTEEQSPSADVWATSPTRMFAVNNECTGDVWSSTAPPGNTVGASNAAFGNDTVPVTELSSGVGSGLQVVDKANWDYFRITVPRGAVTMPIKLQTAGGSVHLYARQGALPTEVSYDARDVSASSNKSICLGMATNYGLDDAQLTPGHWYIGVRGRHRRQWLLRHRQPGHRL